MTKLSYEELDSYIRQICSSEKIVYVSNFKEEQVPLLFRYPTPKDIMFAEFEHKKALAEAKELGLPTMVEMKETIRTRKIFTEEDEVKIAKLKSRIVGQQAILAKTARVPARRSRLKEVIEKLTSQVAEIQYKRESSLELTQERKALEGKFLYTTQKGVFSPETDQRFWKTKEEFNAEPDFLFRKRVFVEYVVFSHGIKQEHIRYIARSNLWRIRYVTATKTSEPLFGVPIADYSVDQLTLLYWSHFYQSIYEMMSDERPADTIIEDDQALDAYMKDWHSDRNRDAAASKSKKNKQYGQSSAWDHQETLVMRSNPMYEDIEYSGTLADKALHQDNSSFDAAPLGRNKKIENPLNKKGS